MMSTIVFGGTSVLGKELAKRLSLNDRVIAVGAKSGNMQCDYSNEDAVIELFESVAEVDAVVCLIGDTNFQKSHYDLSNEDYQIQFNRNLVAQIQLVNIAQNFISDGGSITLTSGYYAPPHIQPDNAIAGTILSALNSFTQQVAPLLDRGIRINTVTPGKIFMFDGEYKIHQDNLANACECYVDSVEGKATGKVYQAWKPSAHASRSVELQSSAA